MKNIYIIMKNIIKIDLKTDKIRKKLLMYKKQNNQTKEISELSLKENSSKKVKKIINEKSKIVKNKSINNTK